MLTLKATPYTHSFILRFMKKHNEYKQNLYAQFVFHILFFFTTKTKYDGETQRNKNFSTKATNKTDRQTDGHKCTFLKCVAMQH